MKRRLSAKSEAAAEAPRRSLRSSILRWYGANRRDLPWRRTRDPYAIWVSEVMLQQTRVETVTPFYHRFLERFPTVERLAGAPERGVLAAWSGLGYYGRARSLHAAAGIVARQHAGRLPRDLEALRALPGIGTYTAAAIASVAYGRTAAAVDGNVIRVLARIAGLKGRRDDGALRSEVEGIAAALAAGPSPGDWTQALMELGALVCAPRAPKCDICPAAKRCAARESGDPTAYPEPAKVAGAVRARRLVLLLARRGARVLLVPDGAGSDAVWGLPSTDASTGAAEGRLAAASLARVWASGAPVEGPAHRFRHRTYAEDLRCEVWESAAPRAAARRDAKVASSAAPAGARWVDPRRIGALPVRGPTLKALKRLAG